MNYKPPHSSNGKPVSGRILLTDTNRWPAPARLAIALAAAGYQVSAICPTPGHPLLKTRAVRRIFSYSGIRPLDCLQSAIEAADPQLIIPCDDRGVRHLHELHAKALFLGDAGKKLAKLIEHSLGSPTSFSVVSSRFDLLRVAREEGILVPATAQIVSQSDLDQWGHAQPLPWVLKADGTWGGSGVRIVQMREEASQRLEELRALPGPVEVIKRLAMNRDRLRLWNWWNRSRPAVIAQSHIHGRPANCAVVCREGKVLAGIGVEVVSAQGIKGPATVVRVVDSPAMMMAASRLAARLGLSGFFGLDFMIEEGSEATYLIEMNPRCTPLCHLQLGAGRDLVGAVRALLADDQDPAPPHSVTDNDLIAYFPQAWRSGSEFLPASFQDMPRDEPALVEDLLRPWTQRGLLGRVVDYLRAQRTLDGSGEYIFSSVGGRPPVMVPADPAADSSNTHGDLRKNVY